MGRRYHPVGSKAESQWHRTAHAPGRHCRRAGQSPETGDWDVVLADYRLPAFSGLEAIQIVQEAGLDLPIPIVIVSEVIGENVAVSAMKAGAQHYTS
ncbi:MAG: response regulator [Deltaproteobacteria bacterium]|nr:response regulator [Deltaproteobacteria bacterium]